MTAPTIEVAIARIKTQLQLVRLNKEMIIKKELETLHALIATYHHEINNALSSAMLSLSEDIKDMSQEKLDDVRNSIKEISDIITKIQYASERNIRMERYSKTSSFIKL